MVDKGIKILVLSGKYGVCRLDEPQQILEGIKKSEFYTITRTSDELSIVCCESCIPTGIKCEKDWRILKIAGPLDFALVGILSTISQILAQEGISIFAISTYDTDYILVKDQNLEKASAALRAKGYIVD